jgi:hypothetical protein
MKCFMAPLAPLRHEPPGTCFDPMDTTYGPALTTVVIRPLIVRHMPLIPLPTPNDKNHGRDSLVRFQG